MSKNKKAVPAAKVEKKPVKKLLRSAIIALLVLTITGLTIWNSWLNKKPILNTITVQESNLPADFDGFRIAQVSDFHSAANMSDLVLERLRSAKPDIICITGDLINSDDKNLDVALDFAGKATEIAQCYFVTGNHEKMASTEVFNALLEGLAERGVILVQNEVLQRGDSEIALFGDFHGDAMEEEFMPGYDGYKIMLSHYPEDMDFFVAAKYDLVLSGHAHGGMFRLPLFGGIYAHGQGLFPEYDAGLYSIGYTDMVVSRGIGDSSFLPRFNNQPEVVLIELKSSN